MRKLIALMLLACLSGCAWEPAAAIRQTNAFVISFDGGGVIDDYIEKYNALRQAGGRIVLDGMCISACTLVTALIPNDRVCVTPFAQLAFHSASDGRMGTFAKEGTRLIWHYYPSWVRRYLQDKGWDGDGDNAHPDLIYMDNEKLREVYRECPES